MGSPKAKVRLEDSSKIIALLDMGAEINVMTKEVMEDYKSRSTSQLLVAY